MRAIFFVIFVTFIPVLYIFFRLVQKNGKMLCHQLFELEGASNSSKKAAARSMADLTSFKSQVETELLVLIITAPDNFEFRHDLRTESYLTHKWKYSFKPSFKVHYSFVMGMSTNQTLLSLMREEAQKYGDVLIGDYEDSYENLVYKTIWLIRYSVTGYSFDFMLKVDDDTFLNPQLLWDFLYKYVKPKYNDKELGYYGGMIRHGPRDVQREGQWGIQRWEFEEDILPSYVVGGCYILNFRAAKELADLTTANVMVAFRIEDAYVGALANRLGLVPRDIPKTYSKQYDRFCGDKGGRIFHRVAPSFQIKMIYNWTTLGYYCPPEQVRTLEEIIEAGEDLARKY